MNENTPTQPHLGLSFAEVGRQRVSQAQLARMLGVTRQAVSSWVRDGKLTIGVDGKVDPAAATKQVVANSDPSRLRARVLREAVEDGSFQRRRIVELEHQMHAANARIDYLEEFSAAQDRCEATFAELVLDRFESLKACDADGRRALIDELRDRATLIADGLDPDNLPDDPFAPAAGERGRGA